MPFYVFSCGACGPFEVRQSASRVGEPVRCPACEGPGKRVFTPPGVRLVAKPLRRALDREEKSAHEPIVSSERTGQPMPRPGAPAPPWVQAY